MSGRRNPGIEAILDEAGRWGAAVVSIDETRRHPHVRLALNGAEATVVCPGTPSDAYRGAENARATVRHALGVASRPAQRGDRRPRRVRAPSAPQPVSGLLEPDTRTSLAEGLARVLPTLGLEARHGPSR